jgi:hypothetical protein
MRVPQLLKEVPRALLDTEQLRQLPDDERQRQADDEPLEYRLGDEVRDEAQPQEAEHHGQHPDGDRQRGGGHHELVRPARRHPGDGRRGQTAVAAIRPTTRCRELPNAA